MEIEYKGFIAKIFFSPDTGSFYGEILNSNDLITFQAASLKEAKEILQKTIDHYLCYMSLVLDEITKET